MKRRIVRASKRLMSDHLSYAKIRNEERRIVRASKRLMSDHLSYAKIRNEEDVEVAKALLAAVGIRSQRGVKKDGLIRLDIAAPWADAWLVPWRMVRDGHGA